MIMIETRLFGTVGVEDDRIITFEDGIVGFPFLKKFTLIKDSDKEDSSIMWLQSLEEPSWALTVINPLSFSTEYEPNVDDELLKPLGELNPFNTFVLNTITVPTDITQMTVNMKAPIIINSDNNKACQVIMEGDYSVKYPIYQQLKEAKERAEEEKAGE